MRLETRRRAGTGQLPLAVSQGGCLLHDLSFLCPVPEEHPRKKTPPGVPCRPQSTLPGKHVPKINSSSVYGTRAFQV